MGWDRLLATISKGDTLVISKLAHVVKGARQLSFFLEFCRIKSVRLVSLHDGIDSANELFPETKTSDLLRVIAKLPEEANAVRKMVSHPGRQTKGIKVLSQAAYGRMERKKLVVNMYKSGLYHRGYMESQQLPQPQFHLPCAEGCRSGIETLPEQSDERQTNRNPCDRLSSNRLSSTGFIITCIVWLTTGQPDILHRERTWKPCVPTCCLCHVIRRHFTET